MRYPQAIQRLIDAFSKLPTVGPKTAERFALHLLSQPDSNLQELSQAIANLKQQIVICNECFAIAETNPCHICTDTRRDSSLICVVADQKDYLSIESSGQFQGRYYVLGKEINHIEGVGPNEINTSALISMAASGKIKEVILALNPTIEGETTSMYMAKLLKDYPVKISKLARGLPMGATLEYVDDMTLGSALKFRNTL
ncbi:recombination protein RecR [Candidatus Falkowbacteria bacterium]|nr:recombination protein RecR [Candidatus Falkowbacteria bacterium]